MKRCIYRIDRLIFDLKGHRSVKKFGEKEIDDDKYKQKLMNPSTKLKGEKT